ncbi:hypothetical protein KDRO_C00210 [Kluyveromyces lactis]|nr:hypothetical protein KDRO_C00210 [Kluyveromyces lactis]
MACLECKKRKQKCDGQKPCGRCTKLNVKCVYGTDRRKDKRKNKDGSNMFIFKNQTLCNDKISGVVPHSSSHDTIMTKETWEPSYPLFSDDVNSADIISIENTDGSVPLQFDLDFTSLESCDVNDFLRLIGDTFPANNAEILEMNQMGDFNTPSISQSIQDDKSQFAIQRNRLIDVIFGNDSHTPPGILREHILELSERHKDLEAVDFDNNGKFLLSTVLCLGALTLRKRELLNRDSNQPSPSGIPEVAAGAYKYYTIATDLIPAVHAAPNIDGFCGLVLMANFMTIMIPLEGQLYLSNNALEVAVALNLHKRENYDEMIVSNPAQLGVFLLFWNLWCSSCMLATLLGKQPFLALDNISLPPPHQMKPTISPSPLSINFMRLRIQLATLQTKIFQRLYVYGSLNKVLFQEIETELSLLSTQISNMKSYPIYDEGLFYRSKVLMLELSCLKAHNAFLLYRPNLIQKKSLHAVEAAKHIILEIWSHYTKQFPKNEKDLVDHLDWNFSYPLRTASLTLSISCVILQKYQQSLHFLEEYGIFEYNLALGVLNDLIQVVPIEKRLINLLTVSRATVEDSNESNREDSLRFWTNMLMC